MYKTISIVLYTLYKCPYQHTNEYHTMHCVVVLTKNATYLFVGQCGVIIPYILQYSRRSVKIEEGVHYVEQEMF